TFQNTATVMKVNVDSSGKYTVNVPPGTYDVTIERTVSGRKRTLVLDSLTVVEGANAIDLWWPSVESAAGRSALVMQHYDAGRSAQGDGRFDAAAGHYRAALMEDCSQQAIWGELAVAQAQGGSFEAAERDYITARAWGAGAATASNMANAYYRAGRFGEAGAKYKAAAEIDPSKAATYLANAGAAYHAGRMTAEAEAAYKLAAGVPGALPSSWYFWGVSAQSNGNRDDALTALRGYLQADVSGRYSADARQRIAALGG
ncbi:MAG: tetratricopeptide repeat protein, partial [Armatimonadota bacterium]|nr:tetratricopeptide repeat protein [Armatimonadota bacterium]